MKKVKFLTIVGARPQIIKASAISRAVENDPDCRFREVILHTGQHYDQHMSAVFFNELGLPEPDYNLGVGSSSHSKQTASMMTGIEEVLEVENPDWLLIYGDTNSTLAGALAASKYGVPVVHIESGLRSYNKSMPEEINRIVADHLSTLLFAPTSQAIENLVKEGFKIRSDAPFTPDNPGLFHTGDIMYDNSLYFSAIAGEKHPQLLKGYGIEKDDYILMTLHRNFNTDNRERLGSIFNAVFELAEKNNSRIIIPLHPRTVTALNSSEPDISDKLKVSDLVQVIQPVSFLEMILLEKNAKLIMTDSGGVQKESHFFGKPCIVLRKETEWTELIENGTAVLADADKGMILKAYDDLTVMENAEYPGFYGRGDSASKILDIIAGS